MKRAVLVLLLLLFVASVATNKNDTCEEYSDDCGWNVIFGEPDERDKPGNLRKQ